jgi:hypothetical protein
MIWEESIKWFFGFGRNKGEHQGQRITITRLGVASEVAFSHQVFHKEAADPGAE